MTIWVRSSADRRSLTYTSRYCGTHKNLLRLVICPIYSVVKVRPRRNVVGRLSLVVRPTTLNLQRLPDPPERAWIFQPFGCPTQCSASKRLSLDRELIHGCRI